MPILTHPKTIALYLGATLERHGHHVDLVIAGGDQAYTDGVPTLDIWRYLNHRMSRDRDSLLPDEASMLSWYRDIYRGYWGFASVQGLQACRTDIEVSPFTRIQKSA